jgi:amino acid adenylation domain-containing protein
MRWTLDPVPGFAVHEVTVPGHTAAALRAAHARVLDELSATPADLQVTLEDNVLRLRYSTEVLDAEAAARVAGYLLAALDGRPDLLSPAERRFQLEALAGWRRELPDRRFHELFEQRVRAHPDAVAAVQGERSWTYAELNARANRLAHALLARGLQREGVVAVVTERTLDWMAAVIAIFKAGGAYLPIEPHFPADRIATMLARAECRLVLDPSSIEQAYAEGHADSDPGIPVAPDQLAYIYFTSGSTGEPKGAMCEHAGMLNHLYAKIDDLEIGAGQVVAQTAPQCFDISLWQLVAALLVGGRTLVVEQETILDAERFVGAIADARVAVLQVVPSYLEVVVSYLEQHPRELPDLRYVSVTGEALKKPLVQRWFAAMPGVRLMNAYGLTETSDDTNHEVMDRPPESERVPLGRPVGNVHVYVVDEQLALVPLGAPGEIVFSGVCVGRGYVNDPDRTRAAFVADPHRAGERLYRSGDYGRWRSDGKLEFLGRRDAQVKIRGFRIEIGEVESALALVPGVVSAAVVVDRSKRLVAFYAGDRPLAPDVLRDSLPDYMIPAALLRRERLPLTVNGKVDRKALAAELDAAGDGHDAPATPAERRVAAAWAQVLGIPQDWIGRRDHFFDRGGTSLSAVKLVIALDRAASLKDVTRFPVLADQARLVDGRSERRSGLLQTLSEAGDRALVCFPYAGGNAVNFQPLARALEGIAVLAVELPGHDPAAEDEPLAPLAQVVEQVAAEIEQLDLGGVMLWGHSTGSAFAVATARELLARGVEVEHVFVGAQLPGALEAHRPADVTAAYRHDVLCARRYLADPPPSKLPVPVTVVIAADDPATAGFAHRDRDWERVAERVDLHELPDGGHYFLRTRPREAAQAVLRAAPLAMKGP